MGIEKRLHTIGVFVDLSKAFDTVDHSILLDKLFHYGIRGLSHNWFKSYLNDRSQYVSINNTFSDSISSKIGVPQGSILGPLLFNVYVNDMVNISNSAKFILFADDTTILSQDPNFNNLILKLETQLDFFHNWCLANKLNINHTKTHCILFGPKILTNTLHFSLKINHIPIPRVQSVKFLGVMVSSNLSWLEHILYISKKISRNLGILNKIKNNFPSFIIKLLYNSLIRPYLTYCITLWGNSCKSHITILTLSQNYFLRILFKLKAHDHVSHLYNISHVMTIKQMFQFHTAILFYKLIVKKISIYHLHLINSFLNHNTRNLRKIMDFTFKKPRTNFYINSPIVVGLKLWNLIPINIKHNNNNLNRFKSLVKLMIIDNILTN